MEKSKCPGISKECFCQALKLIQEQGEINEKFEKALQLVGNGHYVFGTGNKYYEALLAVLKEALNDQFDYISWWLYEGAPDYMIWSSDGKKQWCLKEPGDLYDYILDPDGRKGESSAE